MSKKELIAAFSLNSLLMSTAQNNGCALGSEGLGKLTKSIVTWPISPFSYKTLATDSHNVVRFIAGKLVCGKKHPAYTYSLAWNLSYDPRISISPSGSIINAIEGLDTLEGAHKGAASITPPCLQNFSMYASKVLKRLGMAILTFLGRILLMTS